MPMRPPTFGLGLRSVLRGLETEEAQNHTYVFVQGFTLCADVLNRINTLLGEALLWHSKFHSKFDPGSILRARTWLMQPIR